MRIKFLFTCGLTAILMSCAKAPAPAADPDPLAAFQQRAARFHSVVTVPAFETSTNALATTVKTTMAEAEAALGRIGRLQPGEVSFGNTVRALDDIQYAIGTVANRLSVLKETSTNAALRDAATVEIK